MWTSTGTGSGSPDELSGGQQQRVAIARPLVGPRRLVLADEPTGALDTQTGEAVLRLLRERVDAGAAGVLVTHEARHAAWADRVVFLRDGLVVDTSGPLDQADEPLRTPGGSG
jgi:putative ABC transport system ATP-binding protein